jgi:hypothetical protein
MAEIKRNFTAARMNKDLDERLVKNGEYKDAMNIQIRTTDGDASGTVQNIQGNTPFAYSPSSTYLTNKSKVIGSIANEKNNKAYFLVASPEFNITVTDITARTIWIDSIIEIDSEGFNKTVLNDLYAFSSINTDTAVHTALPNTNSAKITGDLTKFIRKGMSIQLYKTDGTALLSSNTKIISLGFDNTNTNLLLSKTLPSDFDVSNYKYIIVNKPRVLNFSQKHLITGLNVIDEYLFFTDGRSEPKKININRCKAGTTQASGVFGSTEYAHTKLHLNHQITGVSSPITDFETDHIGEILEEHVTVIRKAPRTAPALRMSDTLREGNTQINLTNQDFSNSNVGDSFIVLQDTSNSGIVEGDVINFESLDDQSNSPSIIRVRCISINSGGYIFTINAIDTFIPSTFTNWVGVLEQPRPFFELKFPRFGYRYKYNDGEYSSFSPFSEIAFLPGKFDFDTKNSYNLGMENNLRELIITNFLPEKSVRPDDIETVDILYKSTDSPNVYVIKSINRDIDPEWTGINGNVTGEVKITSDMVYKILPTNQILRPFDNVPRFAKAQEIIANRLIYANYTQGYDLGLQPAISLSLVSNDISELLTPEKSIKSLRSYKVGFVYGDEHGRETPVISPGDRSFIIDKAGIGNTVLIERSDSIKLDKDVSSQVNKFIVQKHWELGSTFKASVPSWADYIKYYIKETSNEYYNLVMDRWYNAEDGNVWISFSSSDRNKVDNETYIILKNRHGDNIAVEEEARFKIIAISNEAPDFIKTDRRRLDDTPVSGNSDYEGDIGYNTATDTEEELRVKRTFTLTESDFFDGHEFKGIPRVRIKAISRDSQGNTKNQAFTSYKKVTRIKKETSNDSESVFDIQFSFGDQAKFIQHFIDIGDYVNDGTGSTGATNATTGVQYFFEFVDDVVENKPEFDGRFFVKIARDSVLDKYIIGKADSGTVYTPEKSFRIAYVDTNSLINPAESSNLENFDNANYNWNGFNSNSNFATNVATQFADATIGADNTAAYWNLYRANADTPIFIDAADATDAFLAVNLLFSFSSLDFAYQKIPENNVPQDFPLDGANRGFAKSGLAANNTFDRLYFSVTRCAAVGMNGNRFQSNAPTGQGLDSVSDFYNAMSTQGTMFKFRNDPHQNVYRIVGGQDILSGGFGNEEVEATAPNSLPHSEAKKRIRQTFYTTFRRIDSFGDETEEGIDFAAFDPRSMFKHDGMSTVIIDVVDRVDTLFDIDNITINSAVWETEPKESADLDIFYEASNAIPLLLNEKNTSEFAPINSTVKVFTDSILQTVSGTPTVTRVFDSIVEIKDPNYHVTSGIDIGDELVFVHQNGTETRSNVVNFMNMNAVNAGYELVSSSATGFYKINNQVHANKVLLPWSNCFTFGNGVESNRIRDDFNAPFIDNGVRVSTTSLDYKQENITNGFIFSGIYNSNSSVNNLNEFNMSEKITKEINPSYGSIQALKARDTDLITLAEDKILRVLANKDALFNADGNANLTSSDKVLGQVVPYIGDYGISRNPESLAVDQFRMYFTDKERGAVLRLSRDGLTPISNVGMRNYFRTNLPKSNSLIGSFDVVSGEYNISLKFKPEFLLNATDSLNVTISDDEKILNNDFSNYENSNQPNLVGGVQFDNWIENPSSGSATFTSITGGFRRTAVQPSNDGFTFHQRIRQLIDANLEINSVYKFTFTLLANFSATFNTRIQELTSTNIQTTHTSPIVTANTPVTIEDVFICTDNTDQNIDIFPYHTMQAGQFYEITNLSLKKVSASNVTLSFNEASKGWVSFKSFVTDSAVFMSGEYYSSNENIIYKHHVDSDFNGNTVNRNTFYGAAIVNSYVDFIFNDFSGSVKNFKTINYEGSQGFQFSINNKSVTDAAGTTATYNDNNFVAVTSDTSTTTPEIKGWKVTSIETDLQKGKVIDFSKKEGKWYGNIVGDFDISNTSFNNVTIKPDFSEISTQGLGVPSGITYTDSLNGVFNLIIQGEG